MNIEIEPLRCPMCGGELMYSEGTHDLCCVENKPELLNTLYEEAGAGDRGVRALHEPKAQYGTNDPGAKAEEGFEEKNQGADELASCVFALSFTESGKSGTLWSIRTVHGQTNYFKLMRLMDKIEKRQRRGERLAVNVPNPPRRVERTKECKLAFRYKLDVEDLYSIKYSSETVNKLAHFYGLTEPDIKHIQEVNLTED